MKLKALMSSALLSSAILWQSSSDASTVDKSPWLGNFLEFNGSLFQEHVHSNQVATRKGDFNHELYADRTTASLGFTPWPTVGLEVAINAGDTKRFHKYGFESVQGAVRYQFLDDLDYDPISLVTGVRFSYADTKRLDDLSSQDHATFESELFLSLGKEFGYFGKSYFHIWGQASGAIGSKGSPWVSNEAHLSYFYSDSIKLDIFTRGEKGYGHEQLHHGHFHSWSETDYRFQDWGILGSYTLFPDGTLSLQFTRRFLAHNYPKDAWSVQVGLQIPFGL